MLKTSVNKSIVFNSGPVTLVGGGQASTEDLSEALKIAPMCVAADGGAALALAAQVPIEALIGDFDSVTAASLSQIPPDRQFKVSEQETTDFDKALCLINAPLVIGVGFLGGRIDHQLAAFSTLARFAHRPCVLLGAEQIVLVAPPEMALATQAGEIVSIYPMAPVHGSSTGLEWPIDGLRLDPTGRIGTSNLARGPATLSMDSPNALLILPRRLILPVVQSLLRSDAVGWPLRAE